MKNSPASSTNRNRLLRGSAALAGTATAALAAPVTVVLETPLVADATATTAHSQIYALNIFSGESEGLNADEGEPSIDINAPGTMIFGSIGVLDGSGPEAKPMFAPIVAGASEGSVEAPFHTSFISVDGGKLSLVVPFGVSTEISQSLFETAPGIENGGLAGIPYLLTLDDAATYNTWLLGDSTQFYLAFNTVSGADSRYGYLEMAYDAPSVSVALLSYGYSDIGGTITTPSEFSAYTPPDDFVMTPVPEPASFATVAALVAGSAALYRRRRSPVAA